MRVMDIEAASGRCRVILGESIARLPQYCPSGPSVIITDSNVRRLHGNKFPDAEIIEIGTGEAVKTLDTVAEIYGQLVAREVGRDTMIIGIGGGVVCDTAGFVGSTYLRGVPFAFVPTTLLAQVDASIGGKNGVNFKGYKNLIGTIRQPQFCLMDFTLLKTLPPRELRSGLAEVVKAGAIADAQLFGYLEENHASVLALKKTAIEKAVHDSLVVKAAIVRADETEKGERMKLNFGHTLGHAIEKAGAFERLGPQSKQIEKATGMLHGEAIAIGMCLAAELSVVRTQLPRTEAERVRKLLAAIGLPMEIKGNKDVLLDAIRKDKKRRGGDVHMVLLEKIGKAAIAKIPMEELEGVVRDLC